MQTYEIQVAGGRKAVNAIRWELFVFNDVREATRRRQSCLWRSARVVTAPASTRQLRRVPFAHSALALSSRHDDRRAGSPLP